MWVVFIFFLFRVYFENLKINFNLFQYGGVDVLFGFSDCFYWVNFFRLKVV